MRQGADRRIEEQAGCCRACNLRGKLLSVLGLGVELVVPGTCVFLEIALGVGTSERFLNQRHWLGFLCEGRLTQ